MRKKFFSTKQSVLYSPSTYGANLLKCMNSSVQSINLGEKLYMDIAPIIYQLIDKTYICLGYTNAVKLENKFDFTTLELCTRHYQNAVIILNHKEIES